MHSSVLFYLVSGAAFASASQYPSETASALVCTGPGTFYRCFNNGFIGDCTSDPCDKAWCPDYEDRSCTRKSASSSIRASSTTTGTSTSTSASIPNYSTIVSTTTRTSTAVTSSSSGVYYSTSTNSKSANITSSRSYGTSTSTRFYTNSTSTRSYSNSTTTRYHTSSTTDDCSETSHAGPTSTKHWTDITKSTETPKTMSTKPPATHTTAYTSGGPYVPPSHSHSQHSVIPSPSPSPCPSCDNKCPPATLPGCLQPAGSYNYYMCVGNGFKGHCTSDPCGKAWCPDFKQGTCEPPRPQDQCAISTVTFTVTATPSTYPATRSSSTVTIATTTTTTKSTSASATATGTPGGQGQFYTCANNGFIGTCSVDPCAIPWCPDYKHKTYEPVAAASASKRDETVCPAGTGYFQVCGNNGFRGCCKSDACGSATSWCADYKPGTYQPVSSGFTTSATTTNGPAATEQPWTPPAGGSGSGSWSDPTVCAPGTGFYQVCGNGFRGCCKSDACTLGYCPN